MVVVGEMFYENKSNTFLINAHSAGEIYDKTFNNRR